MKDVCTLNQNITDKFKHLDDEQYQQEYAEHCRKMNIIDSYEEEILIKHDEEVLNTLNEKGYVILPTDELSKEDKKQRKTSNISFIVKLTNLEK